MGILNITPDSFSDGGLFSNLDAARQQAESMARDGAAIIDVGGESTRPGAADVTEGQELDRVVPVIEAIRQVCDLPISIDSSKPAVMRHAVAAGAGMINDVAALRGAGALEAAAQLQVPVCLMHMQGEPRTMQEQPEYENVMLEVQDFLRQRLEACVDAGIRRDDIVVDPGFGFGKTHAHNVELLANLRQLTDLGAPLLVGLSRKSTLGELVGRNVEERLAASIAAAVIAYRNGAGIIRVHDVKDTVDALKVAAAVMEYSNE
ncbi:MAG: dihydropteroate synthase [Gammaproteobacteria bacterium]|nr:dihydropteroate synthase [Gammaproteobacteria bacterium]